ncbi:hypothetical protein JCM10212_002006 [Sporobolomyces blumeae]
MSYAPSTASERIRVRRSEVVGTDLTRSSIADAASSSRSTRATDLPPLSTPSIHELDHVADQRPAAVDDRSRWTPPPTSSSSSSSTKTTPTTATTTSSPSFSRRPRPALPDEFLSNRTPTSTPPPRPSSSSRRSRTPFDSTSSSALQRLTPSTSQTDSPSSSVLVSPEGGPLAPPPRSHSSASRLSEATAPPDRSVFSDHRSWARGSPNDRRDRRGSITSRTTSVSDHRGDRLDAYERAHDARREATRGINERRDEVERERERGGGEEEQDETERTPKSAKKGSIDEHERGNGSGSGASAASAASAAARRMSSRYLAGEGTDGMATMRRAGSVSERKDDRPYSRADREGSVNGLEPPDTPTRRRREPLSPPIPSTSSRCSPPDLVPTSLEERLVDRDRASADLAARKERVRKSEVGSEAWMAEFESLRQRGTRSRLSSQGKGATPRASADLVSTFSTSSSVLSDLYHLPPRPSTSASFRRVSPRKSEPGSISGLGSGSNRSTTAMTTLGRNRGMSLILNGMDGGSDTETMTRSRSVASASPRVGEGSLRWNGVRTGTRPGLADHSSDAGGTPESKANGGDSSSNPHHKLLVSAFDHFDKFFSSLPLPPPPSFSPSSSPVSSHLVASDDPSNRFDASFEAQDLVKRIGALVSSTTKLNQGLRSLSDSIKREQLEADLDEDRTTTMTNVGGGGGGGGGPSRAIGGGISIATFEKSVGTLVRASDDQVRSLSEGMLAFMRVERERDRVRRSGATTPGGGGGGGSTTRPVSRAGTVQGLVYSPSSSATVSHSSSRSPHHHFSHLEPLRNPLVDEGPSPRTGHSHSPSPTSSHSISNRRNLGHTPRSPLSSTTFNGYAGAEESPSPSPAAGRREPLESASSGSRSQLGAVGPNGYHPEGAAAGSLGRRSSLGAAGSARAGTSSASTGRATYSNRAPRGSDPSQSPTTSLTTTATSSSVPFPVSVPSSVPQPQLDSTPALSNHSPTRSSYLPRLSSASSSSTVHHHHHAPPHQLQRPVDGLSSRTYSGQSSDAIALEALEMAANVDEARARERELQRFEELERHRGQGGQGRRRGSDSRTDEGDDRDCEGGESRAAAGSIRSRSGSPTETRSIVSTAPTTTVTIGGGSMAVASGDKGGGGGTLATMGTPSGGVGTEFRRPRTRSSMGAFGSALKNAFTSTKGKKSSSSSSTAAGDAEPSLKNEGIATRSLTPSFSSIGSFRGVTEDGRRSERGNEVESVLRRTQSRSVG